jgi:hypothetical protein
MKKYKITLSVPSEHEVEAIDAQAAHNEATRLVGNAPGAKVLMIECLGEIKNGEIDFSHLDAE